MPRSPYDQPDSSGYVRDRSSDGIFRTGDNQREDVSADSGVDDGDNKPLSVSELLYSSSSYYAIAKPGAIQ